MYTQKLINNYNLYTTLKLLKRTMSLSTKHVFEVAIPVPWGEVRGKWWGPTDIRPILTTHGWQDSCGSFNRLIPLLLNGKNSFLCIDFPGHGYSSHFSPGMYYNYMDYLLAIMYVIRHFKWDKVSLFGHSLGGSVSLLYSMLYPNRVDFIICSDIHITMNEITQSRWRYAHHVLEKHVEYEDFSKDKEPPIYSLEELTERIHRSSRGFFEKQYAHHIFERNITKSKKLPGKYYFSRDPRVKLDAFFCFSYDDLLAFSKKINNCPLLIIKANQSKYTVPEMFQNVVEEILKSNRNSQLAYVDGAHHVHLNNPERISELITKFIENYDLENRHNSGFTSSLIVNEV